MIRIYMHTKYTDILYNIYSMHTSVYLSLVAVALPHALVACDTGSYK